MRLSAITDEISMDFGHALNVMKEYGCTAAELRNLWNTNIADLAEDQINDAQRLLARNEMEVCGIAASLFKCELNTADGAYDQQMAMLERCVRMAKRFGTKYVRTFAFFKRGELTSDVEDAIAVGISDAVRYAEDNGIVLLLENEHSCYLGTGVETAKFLARINSPALRAIWDPGNAFFADEKPFPDGYNAIRNYVEHVHVKDAELLASGKKRFIVIGEGEIDYKGHFEALSTDGYSGYLSLESHYHPFGGTPEEGSRLCLQGLNKLLSE